MTLVINGIDADTLGFTPARAPGSSVGLLLTLPDLAVPGRAGKRLASLNRDDEPRELIVEGDVVGTSRADLGAKLDMLLAVCEQTTPTVLVFADASTRQIAGALTGWVTTFYGPQQVAVRASVKLTFKCHDPYFVDTSLTTVSGIGSTYTALALGNATVRPTLTIAAGAVSPTISLRDYTDTVVQTMAFSGYTPTDPLVIDCDAMTIMENGVSKIDTLTGGNFLELNPRVVARYALSDWPTINISAGTMSVSYRKAWR